MSHPDRRICRSRQIKRMKSLQSMLCNVKKVGFGKAPSSHVLHVLSCVWHSKARVVIWHGVAHVEIVFLVGQLETNKKSMDRNAGEPFYIANFPRSFRIIVFSFSDNCTGVNHRDGSCFCFCRHTCSAYPSPQLVQVCKAEAHVLGNQRDRIVSRVL